MLNSQETRILETSYDRLKSEITFSNTGKILLKQEFSGWANIHEQRYYHLDNSLFTESIQNTTQIFPR